MRDRSLRVAAARRAASSSAARRAGSTRRTATSPIRAAVPCTRGRRRVPRRGAHALRRTASASRSTTAARADSSARRPAPLHAVPPERAHLRRLRRARVRRRRADAHEAARPATATRASRAAAASARTSATRPRASTPTSAASTGRSISTTRSPTQGNAAAQQFAVVVSNPQPDLVATVTVDEDTAAAGRARERSAPSATATRRRPRSLEVFKLGPKEVDGSAPGTFDTRHAHRAHARCVSRPVRRADRRLPVQPARERRTCSRTTRRCSCRRAALGGRRRARVRRRRLAADDRRERESATRTSALDLRAFLTIVGTQPDTQRPRQDDGAHRPRRTVSERRREGRRRSTSRCSPSTS